MKRFFFLFSEFFKDDHEQKHENEPPQLSIWHEIRRVKPVQNTTNRNAGLKFIFIHRNNVCLQIDIAKSYFSWWRHLNTVGAFYIYTLPSTNIYDHQKCESKCLICCSKVTPLTHAFFLFYISHWSDSVLPVLFTKRNDRHRIRPLIKSMH